MAKHLVKCPYCGETFDTNEVEYVQLNKRYAHKSCHEAAGGKSPFKTGKKKDAKEDSPERKEILDYVAGVYGASANYPIINKQITRFIKELGFTPSGILSTLKYIYEVKHMTTEKSNGGIGLVEYMYQQARDYYYSIWLAQQNGESRVFISEVKEYVIKPQRAVGTKTRLLEWEYDNEEE